MSTGGLGNIQGSDPEKYRYLVDTITWLLPKEKNSVSCSFLIKLLQTSIASDCGQTVRSELKRRIGLHMEDATVELVSGFSRPSHDGIYGAIDMYLKEHPGINKSQRKRICRLMDCRNLSAEACMHAVQNERLPLRVVVQVLWPHLLHLLHICYIQHRGRLGCCGHS
ncbi:hypothetical protein K7X08_025779 [Anisodus acutangulus]|uniref:NPH3 domain-containing protein n=1 Tax=Anisodus acutangulus TaxID=402998 RepID=A0A9Q1LB85_9SOLA|nr:hypothetical protein K7X08_025779 [Anisodus acutangulus]